MPSVAEEYGMKGYKEAEPTPMTIAEEYGMPEPERTPEEEETNVLGEPKSAIDITGDFILDSMAAVNKGAIALIDLPLAAASATSELLGGTPFKTIADIPWVKQGTYTQRAKDVPGHEYATTASEFIGGGLTMAGAARKMAAKLPAIQPKLESTMNGILREFAKVPLKTEALAATGAATGAVTAKKLGGGPNAQFMASMVGGAAFVAPNLMYQRLKEALPFSKAAAERRVSFVLKNAAEDLDEAVIKLADNNIDHITAMEATNDMGMMTLQKSIIAEDTLAEADYHKFFRIATQALKEEVARVTGKDGKLDKGLLQDYLKQNIKVINTLVDDRIAQAQANITEYASLGRGRIHEANIARKAKFELIRAKSAARRQEQVLWEAVGKDVQVDMSSVKAVARAAVEGAAKKSKLPKKELENIIGFKIKETDTGYAISDKAVKGAFLPQESMKNISSLRSELLSSGRIATSGIAPNPNKARILNDLQDSVIKAIEENPLASNYDVEMYKAATSFTRKFHDTFTRGLVGDLLAKDVSSDSIKLEEMTLQFLLGTPGAKQARGAREVSEVFEMSAKTGYSSKPLMIHSQEFIAGRFQQEVKNYGDALDFMLEHQYALERFPHLRNYLNEVVGKMGKVASKVERLEAKRSSIEKNAFQKLTNVSGRKAISHVLDDVNPLRSSKRLFKLTKNSPKAQAGFKNDIAEYILDETLKPSVLPEVDTAFNKHYLQKTLDKMDPILKTWYSDSERRSLNKVLKAISAHNTSGQAPARKVELMQTPLFEFISRYSVVRAGAAVASGADAGSSLMLAQVMSKVGKHLARAIPIGKDKELLRRAIMDKELLNSLLLKQSIRANKAKTANQIFKALAYESQYFAEEFEKNLKELDPTIEIEK
jgi:hypothetical protein